jgi:polyisoprenyl-teichoic acid--peptidoglycan teichoic acid transferase
MQQVQQRTPNSRTTLNTTWLIGGSIVLFALLAGLIAFITFTRVRDFIATWNITDLPGIVVDRNASPTDGAGEAVLPGENPGSQQVVIGPEPQPWDGASRVNILVMGLDYRDWESGEGAPRTDTMILFSIDPISKTIGLVSIPRDLWVNIPGFEEPDRINVAYRFGETYELPGGGPELAMKTVEGLLGLQIDYYALVEFSAFEQFIDELGGIEITVDKNIWIDPIDGETVKLKKKIGDYELNGSLALAYARARNSKGGDFDRAERQQQVILAIRDRVLQANMLPVLVTRAPALYDQISAGVHTNLTLEQAVQLAWLAQQIPEEDIKRGTIGAGQINFYTSPDGDQVLKPRSEQIRILRDEIFTSSGPASPALEGVEAVDLMKTENASISIFNGSGTPGLATRTAEYLTSLGANVVSTGDATDPYYVTTVVSYQGHPYTLRYLADLMTATPPQIYNRFDPSSEVDLIIYLGSDWANNNPMP